MIKLTWYFIKIFFRNRRAIIMAVLLPAAVFLALAFLEGLQVLSFDVSISYQDFLLAGIVAYALMQTGIYMTAYSLLDYKRIGILKRFAVTPLSARDFLGAQILSRFIVGLVQTLLLVLLAVLVFEVKLNVNAVFLPALVLVGIAVFINFGFLIAAIARDYDEAAPYNTIITLGLAFVGDVFFSVQNFPDFLQILARVLPLQPLASLTRFAMFGTSSGRILEQAVVLLAWFVGLYVIAWFIFQRKAYK